MGFELWWILAIFPLTSLWNALTEAWAVLLKTPSETERKAVIERAAMKALLNSAGLFGIWLVPWPYKALCWLPTIFPFTFRYRGNVVHFSLGFKLREKL